MRAQDTERKLNEDQAPRESSEAMGRGKEGKGLVDFLVHTVSVASKLLITGRQEPGNLEREKPTTTQGKVCEYFHKWACIRVQLQTCSIKVGWKAD